MSDEKKESAEKVPHWRTSAHWKRVLIGYGAALQREAVEVSRGAPPPKEPAVSPAEFVKAAIRFVKFAGDEDRWIRQQTDECFAGYDDDEKLLNKPGPELVPVGDHRKTVK